MTVAQENSRPDLATIKAELTDRAEDLATDLMGLPNRDTKNRAEWRWGSKGSVAFIVKSGRGKTRGSFYSHEASQGGSPLDLIMHARGCGIAEAIRWAEHWLGHDAPGYQPDPGNEARLIERARRKAEQEAEAAAHEASRTKTAQRVWQACVGVEDDNPAGLYLTRTRGIIEPISGWPHQALGYHAPSRSLVVAATTDDGSVQAIQQIYLTSTGHKVGDDERVKRRIFAVKETTGPTKDAAVRLPGDPDGPLLLCEGPETGLSAWMATGHEVWIGLGKLNRMTPPKGRTLVLCRDDDRKKKPGATGPDAEETHRRLTQTWRSEGHTLVTVLPWTERRFDGSDLNDVLRQAGPDAVRAAVNAAVPPNLPSEYELPTKSLDEAQDALREPLSAFFAQSLEWAVNEVALRERQQQAKRDLIDYDGETFGEELTLTQIGERNDIVAIIEMKLPIAPHAALKVGLGIGKTHSTAEGAAAFVAASRSQGLAGSVLWTCPTLDLADQTGSMLAGHGVEIGIYRGREAFDPNGVHNPEDEDSGRMCLDLPSVRLALDAGAVVAEAVCGTGKDGKPVCEHYEVCPYQKNIERMRDADVVLAAHNSLFHPLPAKVDKRIGLTVIDEAFWQHGLRSSRLALNALVDDINVAPVLDGKDKAIDHFATDRLRSTMEEVCRVLTVAEDGAPLSDFGALDPQRCREAAREQWRRMVDIEMRPGMPLAERRVASRKAQTNLRIPAMARLLRTLADVIDKQGGANGRLEVETVSLKEGPVRRVLIHERQEISASRTERPILHLDATMPLEAVRQYAPNMRLMADVQAVMPHMTTVQVLSTKEGRGGWGKHSVVPSDTLPPDESARRTARIDRLRDFFRGQLLHRGEGLVVTYQAIEGAFQGIEGLETGHFNALAGINRFERVSFAAVIGRPMPNPYDTALLVKQLFGQWCEPTSPQERWAGLLMADGSRKTIMTRRYDSPEMEIVRKAIADDNVSQAVGRVRGVRREETDPVFVLLMTDCVTGFPLTAVTDWQAIAPDRVERMAARGLILRGPTDAARAYPDLFRTPEAAREALKERARSTGGIPTIGIILGDPPVDRKATEVRYRPAPTKAEPKPKTRICEVTDPRRLPGIRDFLTDLVGPLAFFEIAGAPPEPTSPAVHAPDQHQPAEYRMPATIPLPANDGFRPAALYPASTASSWETFAPVVDMIGLPGPMGHLARHPIGKHVAPPSWDHLPPAYRPPSGTFLPEAWAADVTADLGRLHEQAPGIGLAA